MTESRSGGECCRLCGTALADAVAGQTEGAFCSSGCRDVYEAIGAPDESGGVADAAPADVRDDDTPRDGAADRAYFRIDGMHAAPCETFLESVAEGNEGVRDAAASYVTETVRVEYDPDRISPDDLRDALTTVGYTAYRREEAVDESDGAAGTTRRSREMTGLRKRRADDVLELRYVLGVVFGSFLLVPYVTIFYPVFLAAYADWGILARYQEAFASIDGLLLLPLFVVVTGAVLYLTGAPLLRGAYVGLRQRTANTHLLAAVTMVAAFAYGTLAFVLGRPDVYYDLTIVVAATVMGAVFYEASVKRRALDRLTDLTVSQVGEARRLADDGTTEEVPVADLTADDRVLVRQGERIPVDGTLLETDCTVDEAVVTGESLPVSKRPGDDVVGGSVVAAGAAIVDPAPETESGIERLTETVWNVQSATHGVGRRADRLAAALVVPLVAVVLGVGAAQLVIGASATDAATAVLLTAIVASPWALGVAAPLSVAASVREALERGVVVFDETVFERLRGVDVVVFDKTGTLTTGEMTVLAADAPDALLCAAGALEARAAHPAATAIADAFVRAGSGSDGARTDGGTVDGAGGDDSASGAPTVVEFRSHATGVEGVVDGRRVLVGHPDLFRERGWPLESELESRIAAARERGRLPVVVGRDGAVEGVIVVGDETRATWDESLARLRGRGVAVVVLTGDHAAASEFLAAHDGVAHVFADVPPDGKTAAIRSLGADRRVAMVGDGTNDAPALAAADLGIALGGGTALAADAADLAILEDDLAAVERAFALSAAAGRRVTQNLGLSLVYNAVAIPAAALGLLNPLATTVGAAAAVSFVGANAARPLLDRD